jgi:16S rRNA (cytosine967-C5)-methyltransferase
MEAHRHNLPEWLVEPLKAQLGDGFWALAASMEQAAPLDLRVNTLNDKRSDLRKELEKAGIKAEPTPFSPIGLRGRQARAGQGRCLQPRRHRGAGRRLAAAGTDAGRQARRNGGGLCAGAGGKTLAIGAAMRNTGRLYAFDVSGHRLDALKPRLARSGLSNVHPAAIAHERDERVKRLAGKIDRVLVDAPCSGLGTLRRNPDLKWRQSVKAVQELTQKQAAILESSARLVKAGGRLIYATCSILPRKTSHCRSLQRRSPEFVPLDAGEVLEQLKIADGDKLCSGGDEGRRYLRLWPHQHETDGFFAAVWVKKA